VTEPDATRRYIEDHRGQFTREAIDAELIKAGHEPEDIARAWMSLETGWRTPDPSALGPGLGTILLVLVVIASYGFAAYLAVVFALPDTYLGMKGVGATILLVYAAAMVIAGAYSVYRLVRAPSTGGGARVIGVAFGISIVMFVGLSGLCIAGLSTANQ
jgi:hypothetical protein